MGAFLGINGTATVGNVVSVSATKIKAQVMGTPNENASGITFFVDYTKGTAAENSITLTATFIAPGVVSATDEYSFDSSSSATPAALAKTYSATGKWMWPIAIPALAKGASVVLTMTTSGSADHTTVVSIKAVLDTVYGK